MIFQGTWIFHAAIRKGWRQHKQVVDAPDIFTKELLTNGQKLLGVRKFLDCYMNGPCTWSNILGAHCRKHQNMTCNKNTSRISTSPILFRCTGCFKALVDRIFLQAARAQASTASGSLQTWLRGPTRREAKLPQARARRYDGIGTFLRSYSSCRIPRSSKVNVSSCSTDLEGLFAPFITFLLEELLEELLSVAK